MKLKERFNAWRKAKIEALYFKSFPERKGMATMEIVKSTVMPQTFYRKTMIDPWMDKSMLEEAIPHLKKDMARKIGEDLLERGMIDIQSDVDLPDPTYYGKALVGIIRVLPPEKRVRWPR